MSLGGAIIRVGLTALVGVVAGSANTILLPWTPSAGTTGVLSADVPSVQPLRGSAYEPIAPDDAAPWVAVPAAGRMPRAAVLGSGEAEPAAAAITPSIRQFGAERVRYGAVASIEPPGYRTLDYQHLQPTLILVGNEYLRPGDVNYVETPEPHTFLLLSLGLAVLAARGWRSKGRRSARASLSRHSN